MDNIKLFIATPCIDGKFGEEYVATIYFLTKHAKEDGIEVEWYPLSGSSILPMARNSCVKKFLESDCTHMLFLDADVGARYNDIIASVKAGQDIVAIPYPMRSFSHIDAVRRIIEGDPADPAMLSKNISNGTYRILPENDGRSTEIDGSLYVEVDYAGTGAMIVARKVFEEMIEAFGDRWTLLWSQNNQVEERIFEFFQYGKSSEGEFIGEDAKFCYDWKSLGGKVWIKWDSVSFHRTSISAMWQK